MTARLVPAAQQLLDQLRDRKTKPVLGQPDGLDRIRSITFDAATSRWLVPIMEAIDDPRVRDIHTNGRGRATIRFVSNFRADFKDPYPIDQVDDILNT